MPFSRQTGRGMRPFVTKLPKLVGERCFVETNLPEISGLVKQSHAVNKTLSNENMQVPFRLDSEADKDTVRESRRSLCGSKRQRKTAPFLSHRFNCQKNQFAARNNHSLQSRMWFQLMERKHVASKNISWDIILKNSLQCQSGD